MTEANRRRRKRSHSNQRLLSVVWLVAVLALLGGGLAAGLYAYSKLSTPKVHGLPPAVPWSEIQPTFEDIVDEAYGKKYDVKHWEKTPTGKRGVTDGGFTVEITQSASQATVVIEGAFERQPNGSLASIRMVDFCVCVMPSEGDRNRIGDRGADEIVELKRANANAQGEFNRKWMGKSPVGRSSAKGKMLEATATFSYDDAAKKCIYRMEIKKLG
jgi:hypothetical protein